MQREEVLIAFDSVVILDLSSLHFSDGIARRETPLRTYRRHSCSVRVVMKPIFSSIQAVCSDTASGYHYGVWSCEGILHSTNIFLATLPCSSQDARHFSNAVFKARTSTSVQRRTHARSINIDERVVRHVVWDDVMKLAWPRARQDVNVNNDERRFLSVKLLRHRPRTKRCILSLLNILNTGWVSRQRTRVYPPAHHRDLKPIRMERRSLRRHRKCPR